MKLDQSESCCDSPVATIAEPEKQTMELQADNDSDDVTGMSEEERDLLREVAMSGEQREPFFICNQAKINENVQEWKRLVPKTMPYYGKKKHFFN